MNSFSTVLKRPRIILASALTVGVLTSSAVLTDEYFEISKNLEIFTSLYKELNLYYVDETQPGSLMKTAIDGMLRSLDPYTVYYPESKIEDAMFMQTGQYGGIGTLINTMDGNIIISEPYEGSPAAKAGLMAGDVIVKVNGKSVEGLKYENISEMLMGQPGSIVEIVVKREGENQPLTMKVTREEIKIPDVPYYSMDEDGTTGYIKLTGFTQTASTEVRTAFLELKKHGMKQCILDLRGNGGGLLREAVSIVNFFVPKGTEIVSTKGKLAEWNKRYDAINEPLDTEIPLVVFVDEMSASASEIVSGSLQDLDRAVVIGSESFGKGLVQQTKDLAYNSKMKVTVAKYYTPSGRCIQRLDYSHRDDETGQVTAVNDSLIKPFKTRAGRTVFDGRGINPDVPVDPEEAGNVVIGLMNNWVVFNYATKYKREHSKIDSADKFQLTDSEYNDFVQWAKGQSFEYNTATEELYKELKKVATEEKYYVGAEKEFDELFAKIEPHKEQDMLKFKDQIKEYLENEIVSRYYYQDGRIEASLLRDPCMQKAKEVFKTNYRSLLMASTPAKK